MRRTCITAIAAAALAFGMLATSSAASPPPDGATIVNSGSTNFSGYTISVNSDATATVVSSARGGGGVSAPKAFKPDAAAVKKFFADLATAKSQGMTIEPCMKSASFGSTTRVTWHGWTTPDLSCPPSGAAATALVRDVQAITAASGATASLRRGPVMLRQPDLSPNTPEPSPTSS